MIPLLALALLAADPPEDAAHRADRLRTIELNRRAAAATAGRERRNAAAIAAQADYRAARARYEAEMAAWRRRVAACDAGDRAKCARN